MAEITRGISFGTNDSVTNTKLHNLIDLATIANIVNADISASAAIADSKLAQITTAGKVSSMALSALSSLPTSAGYVPVANLASIPNTSLLPISLASWIDGASFKNLASIPSVAGIIPLTNVGSLLGARASKSSNTVYQAATDGFFEGWYANSSAVQIKTDSSNPPTTVLRESTPPASPYRVGYCVPIRKNDYYKIDTTSDGAHFFTPLGS